MKRNMKSAKKYPTDSTVALSIVISNRDVQCSVTSIRFTIFDLRILQEGKYEEEKKRKRRGGEGEEGPYIRTLSASVLKMPSLYFFGVCIIMRDFLPVPLPALLPYSVSSDYQELGSHLILGKSL